MEDFTAEKARELVANLKANEEKEVLDDIKIEATNGNRQLYVHRFLEDATIEGLKSKGFKITFHNALSSQRDRLYYIINW